MYTKQNRMKSENKVLVIGGYRGIGNKLAKLYLYNGDQVFVTYSRLKPKGYKSKNISFLKLELNNHRKFVIFIKKLKKIKFDIVLFVSAVNANSKRIRKKYWLLPIIIVLVLFGGLIILSQGSVVAPFIYTIF